MRAKSSEVVSLNCTGTSDSSTSTTATICRYPQQYRHMGLSHSILAKAPIQASRLMPYSA